MILGFMSYELFSWHLDYIFAILNFCKYWTEVTQYNTIAYATIFQTHGNYKPLQWRHNELNGVSNHQRLNCLLNRLFRLRSEQISKLRVTGLCEGNSPVTGEFPAQRASNAKNISIWWRHHTDQTLHSQNNLTYVDSYCRSVHQGQGQVITSHSICGMQLLVPALDTCFWHTSPHMSLYRVSWSIYFNAVGGRDLHISCT